MSGAAEPARGGKLPQGAETADRIRIGLIADFLEEGWPSMDLVAEMLEAELRARAPEVEPRLIRPALRRRFSGSGPEPSGPGWALDRAVNRFWDYPRFLRRIPRVQDVYHLVDHTYAHLVHHLPARRTVVTCHDLDAFRCVIDPATEPRSVLFRTMTRRILRGLQKAERIICVSQQTRDQLLAHGLASPERAVVIANGVHPSCSSTPDTRFDREAERLIGHPRGQTPILLHVGSTVARKRIDVLLRAFAAVRQEVPAARLVRIGGALTEEQRDLAGSLGVADSLSTLPSLTRDVLAAVYRRADLLLQPSDREGFGLPIIEALACGTPVIASDIPVFREIGGDRIEFAPPGDVHQWGERVLRLLREREQRPESWEARREAGEKHASAFTWAENAKKTLDVYRDIEDWRYTADGVRG